MTGYMNRHQTNPGFTLIEMLIAMAMMATIVSMVYGSYAATSQSMETYSSRLTYSERASQVLRLMTRQIRGAYARQTEPNTIVSSGDLSHTPLQPLSPRPGQTQIDGALPIFSGGNRNPHGEILSFTTTTGLGSGLNGPRGLSQIRYRHDPITNTLWIDCRPYTDRLRRVGGTQGGRPILDRVTAVDIEFHDGRQWHQKWDNERQSELPRAVRIGLSLVDEKGRSYRFGTTVQVLSRTGVASRPSKLKTERGRL